MSRTITCSHATSLKLRALDGPDKGIIPQTCSELFVRVAGKRAADQHLKFTVEVSYIEVRRSSTVRLKLFIQSRIRADIQ